MYNILLSLHSILRWIILILLLVNILRHFIAMKKPFSGTDKQLGLWLMISAHITFLIGIYQWFAGVYGYQNLMNRGVTAVMENGTYRFFAIEHTVGMLIAIALITVARGVYRKQITDSKKHRRCINVVFTCACINSCIYSVAWYGSNWKTIVKRLLI